jgi:hypothetical protein
MSVRKCIWRAYELLDRPRQVMLTRPLHDPQASARFDRLRVRYPDICQQLIKSWNIPTAGDPGDHYDWPAWAATVYASFQEGVSPRFLTHPDLVRTMVFGARQLGSACRQRAHFVAEVFGKEETKRLLREDAIGGPRITDSRWLTSANRVHHAGHLARYYQVCKHDFATLESIVEWGGGYGNIARLVKRRNPKCTYLILDLPQLLALQYIYLGAILGEDAVHLGTPQDPQKPGVVNLLPSSAVAKGAVALRCDGFLSTWALNESPAELQRFVAERGFFGARSVLLGYAKDQNNCLLSFLGRLGINECTDSFLPGNSAYAFRWGTI